MRRIATLILAIASLVPSHALAQSGDPRLSNVSVYIDSPAFDQPVPGPDFHIQGWAALGSGCADGNDDTVHLFLDGPAGVGQLLGAATLMPRPDVAAAFNCPGWANAGFSFDAKGISTGAHTLYVYPFVAAQSDRPSVQFSFTVTSSLIDPALLPGWNRLLSVPTYGPRFASVFAAKHPTIRVGTLPQDVNGEYDAETNTVTISDRLLTEDPGVVAAVLAHEMTHVSHGAALLKDTPAQCIAEEVEAYGNESAVWQGMWSVPPERTQEEQNLNYISMLLAQGGQSVLSSVVAADPGFQQQCGLTTTSGH